MSINKNLKYTQSGLIHIYRRRQLLTLNIISIVHATGTKTQTLAHQKIYSGNTFLEQRIFLNLVSPRKN